MNPFHLLLYHFAPQESVRLICYGPDGKLQAWQEIRIDQSGNQLVKVATYGCAFVALGASSGEVHQIRDVTTGTVRKTCGGLMTRLESGMKARLVLTDGTSKPRYALPGYSQEVKDWIAEGAVLTIKNIPSCSDGSLWWRVGIEDQSFGWMSEEQNGVYLLEPVS